MLLDSKHKCPDSLSPRERGGVRLVFPESLYLSFKPLRYARNIIS